MIASFAGRPIMFALPHGQLFWTKEKINSQSRAILETALPISSKKPIEFFLWVKCWKASRAPRDNIRLRSCCGPKLGKCRRAYLCGGLKETGQLRSTNKRK